MGEELGQVAVNGGVSVVLAVVVMRWLRADLLKRADECKACAVRAMALAESERADKLAMIEALQRNTEAITRLVDAVRAIGGNGRLEAHERASGRVGREGDGVRDLRGKLAGSEGYERRKLSEVRYVVVHHSGVAGASTAEGIAAWHVEQLGWPGIGYHVLVHEDGSIDYVGDIATVRYHVAGRNRECLGVCIPGDFMRQTPNELQLGAARNLVRVLRPLLDPEECGRVEVVGHRDVALAGYGTGCPGETWREWLPVIGEGMAWEG